MVDMTSKKYFKLYCVLHSSSNENWFALSTNTVLATKFQQTSIQLFFFSHKLFKMLLHWHTFFQHVPHVENTFIYTNTYAYVFFWPV